jgi:hypothetical protein
MSEDKKRRRPRLGRGLAEKAAKPLEDRESQLEEKVKEAQEGEKVRDTSKDEPPAGFKSPR